MRRTVIPADELLHYFLMDYERSCVSELMMGWHRDNGDEEQELLLWGCSYEVDNL